MTDLNTIVQGWKAHVKRPVDCKNCPYLGGKGCSAGLGRRYLSIPFRTSRKD